MEREELVRAVAYARVSSATQRERDTIASQLRVLPEFIARQGWELTRPVGTYIDDGRSAKAGKLEARTGLAALLRDAAAGAFDVVCVVDVDRLTRSEDLAERGAILGALQRAGVKVASATSGQVLDLSTSTGDLFTTLHAFFAAEWGRKHRERIIQGKLTAIGRGKKPSGPTPYGLTYSRETGTWSLNPATSEVVRELFRRVIAGESTPTIAEDFNARGITPPARGGYWDRNRLWRIVRAQYPMGVWVADRRRRLQVTVPPIVDGETWHAAQAAMACHGKRGLIKTKHVYLLEGLGRCGLCGAPMAIRSPFPRMHGPPASAAYICRDRRVQPASGSRCTAPILPTNEVDERVWSRVSAELADPALVKAVQARMDARTQEQHDWESDAVGFRSHLARLAKTEAAVLARYRRGTISDEALDVELASLQRERTAVQLQLATAERGAAERAQDRSSATQWLEELRELAADLSPKSRQRVVRAIVEKGGAIFDGSKVKLTLLVEAGSRAASSDPRVALAVAPGYRSHHESHMKIRVVA